MVTKQEEPQGSRMKVKSAFISHDLHAGRESSWGKLNKINRPTQGTVRRGLKEGKMDN